MELKIEKKPVVEVFDTPIVQQTSFWSRVKSRQGLKPLAFDFKARNRDLYLDVGGYSYTSADFLMFLQYYNSDECLAYVPYGPEVEPSAENQGCFLEEISEQLRSYLPKGCAGIRYDLNWQSHWIEDSDFQADGQWLGAPEKCYQEFQRNYDTVNGNLLKSNSDILPSDTIIMDISGTEEQILMNMRPKTRYNINLSLRKGIEVRQGSSSDLGIWYELYLETAKRNRLHINELEYFNSVFASRIEDDRSPVHVRLLIAYLDDIPLAAMFLVVSSNRATYLYGASSSQMRNYMPTYALQWQAIRTAKSFHCSEYDMFGISPSADPSHPMYGLYRFKTGFGGQIYHQMGCWDYPLDKDIFSLVQASEMTAKGYYL